MRLLLCLSMAVTLASGCSRQEQLVGSTGIQQIQVQPESPSPDDVVSLRIAVKFTGKGNTPAAGLPLRATVERKGEQGKPMATADLSLPAGLGVSGETQWSATAELGKLPEGEHTFVVAIQRPAQGLVGAIEPPREVQVVVTSKKGP